jgi:hypothetical protein
MKNLNFAVQDSDKDGTINDMEMVKVIEAMYEFKGIKNDTDSLLISIKIKLS